MNHPIDPGVFRGRGVDFGGSELHFRGHGVDFGGSELHFRGHGVDFGGSGLHFRAPTAHPKRFSDLERRLSEVGPNERLRLSVSVAHENDGGIVWQMLRAVGQGNIGTFAESEAERMRILSRRAEAVKRAIEPVRQAVEALGGEVRPSQYQYRLGITLSAARVPDLEVLPEVESLGIEDLPTEPASRQNRVREAAQVNQYIHASPTPFDGGDRSAPNMPIWTVGFGENTAPDDEHPGFMDFGTLLNRVRMFRQQCNDTSCWTVSNFGASIENDHPTACLGLVLGDLEDGQDPTVTDPTTREERSGYSPESWGRVYRLSGGDAWHRILDDVTGSSPPTPIVNSSNEGDWDIPECLGRTILTIGYELMDTV